MCVSFFPTNFIWNISHCDEYLVSFIELHAEMQRCLTPSERARGIRWVGSWVGRRTSLDTVKTGISSACWKSVLVIQFIATHNIDGNILAIM
jgi:hypothetical protein